MRIDQKKSGGWKITTDTETGRDAQLVLSLRATARIDGESLHDARVSHSNALIAGCSPPDEIRGIVVADDTPGSAAIHFKNTKVRLARAEAAADNYGNGATLARALNGTRLPHVAALSDRELKANGTERARGLRDRFPERVSVTGSLASNGDRFQRTLVFTNNAPGKTKVAAIGFCASRLNVGYGFLGGWDTFVPEHTTTCSKVTYFKTRPSVGAGYIKKNLRRSGGAASCASVVIVTRAARRGPGQHAAHTTTRRPHDRA